MIKSTSPAGYAEASPSPPNPAVYRETKGAGLNPYIRCPLPPFNTSADVLRQYDESGKVPTRRVIPLPVQIPTGTGTTKTITNVLVTAAQTASGTSSTSSGTTLAPMTLTVAVPALAPGQIASRAVAAAKSFQLMKVTASAAVEVRLYGSTTAQTIDLARATDQPVAFEVVQNVITCVVFDTPPYSWDFQNRAGKNSDSTPSSTLYVNVANPSPQIGVSSSTVTIIIVPLVT